ncbi:MAG TPA: LamG-like jellyroll fold domain-containing protein, partial [Nitrososphaeraceae archaeon]
MKDVGFGIVVVFCLLTLTLIAIFSGLVDPSNRMLFAQSKLIYGCVRIPNNIHCDPVPNRFSSILVPGDAQEIYAVTPSSFETVPGIFGNALPLKGYVGQFLTIQNNPTINPKTFSVSLWAKLDPSYDLDSTIIAHSNRENTAGWFIRIKIGQPQPELQFSVTNTQGQIFTAKAPIDKDKFRFIVGTFDGTVLKLYSDGVLIDKAEFSGPYQPNPEGPLNLGVDTFDHTNAWKGVIDDVRLFNRVISDSEIGDILSGKFVAHEGLTGYWSFDNNTKDNSGNGNDGLLSTQAVSMIFAPDGRLFFTEKNLGDVRIIKDDKILPQPFVTIKDVYVAQHQGLLGITLDPKFESNHYVYVYYTSKGNKTGENFNRVVRF